MYILKVSTKIIKAINEIIATIIKLTIDEIEIELKKLQELYSNKLIAETEFQKLKQKILEISI